MIFDELGIYVSVCGMFLAQKEYTLDTSIYQSPNTELSDDVLTLSYLLYPPSPSHSTPLFLLTQHFLLANRLGLHDY